MFSLSTFNSLRASKKAMDDSLKNLGKENDA